MFDLTIPLMCSRYFGSTVLSVAGSVDSWLVQLCKGVCVIDLLKLWHDEAYAVLGGIRQSGILPMQIRRDWQNRIGCTRGVFFFRRNNQVFVSDVAEIKGSFSVPSEEWWKCLSAEITTNRDIIGPISVASFASWADRISESIFTNLSIVETNKYYRDVRKKNADILSSVLSNVSGGKELLSKFPQDYMKRLMFINRTEDGNKDFRIGWEAGDSEFDGVEILGGRDIDALIWWMNTQLCLKRMVAFLCPHDIDEDNVSLFIIKPGDNVTEIVSEALDDSQLNSDCVDHVIFSLNSDGTELQYRNGRFSLRRKDFVKCLVCICHVAVGIIKESAWAEFSVCE